ncbi:hypothetical protein MNBD_NITROSPINAE02-681 [hydrothermal vent metagenome]|uniref:PilZ domain-containing protein n=1 Tax=hydrothermal vent metagenome TaxID=652676 RepID=A0A3B1D142_9ZZZZ
MRPALGIDVNRKIQLKLSEDAGADSYTCLVKKVKENLVALVISNRDKHNVNPAVGDRLFLLNEWEDDCWVTPVTLLQNQSFPLIILKVIEEPYSMIAGLSSAPPAPMEELDSIVEDHGPHDEDLITPVDVSEEPVIIPAGSEEEPTGSHEKHLSQGKEVDATDDLDPQENGVGIDEQVDEILEDIESIADSAEAGETGPIEPFEVDEEYLNIPDDEIADESPDTEDEQDAELEELSDSIEEIFGDPDDMAIVPDDSIDISDISDITDDAPENADTFQVEEKQEPLADEPEEIAPAMAVEPSGDEYDQEEKFNDHFVVFLTPIDREMVEDVMESIKSTGKKPSGEPEPGEDHSIDLPGGLDPSAIKIMETLSSHILNIEKTIEELKTNISSPFFNPLGEQTSAICVSISEKGMDVVIENRLEEKKDFLVSVDRPWRPDLKFTATVIVDSVEKTHGVDVAKMSFTAIHPQGISSINSYLAQGDQYFRILEKFRRA